MEAIGPSRPELIPYVETFWFLKSAPGSDPYLLPPDPNGTLIFSFDSATRVRTGGGAYSIDGHFCTGLRSSPVNLIPRGPVDYVAVQLKPYALRSLLGIHAREAADYFVELDDVCPAFSREASESLPERPAAAAAVRIIEEILLERLLRASLEPPRYIPRAIEEIVSTSGGIKIRTLCEEIGITARQLEREFDRWVGIPAKLFARIARMNTALGALQECAASVDLADFALYFGYYDQSHLCGDFADLVGISPRRIIELTHAP